MSLFEGCMRCVHHKRLTAHSIECDAGGLRDVRWKPWRNSDDYKSFPHRFDFSCLLYCGRFKIESVHEEQK